MSEVYATAPEWITDAGALLAWGAAVAPGSWLAIDTEFERQRTYFAELCLVQLATPGRIACVDVLAFAAGPGLAALFGRTDVRKILHAARQDLEVLHQAGAPLAAPLFDTQIAAALIGCNEQIGYADLVRELLGIEIDKSQTRTDWRRRPLTPAQLAYAADDVRHLPALVEHLGARLEALGRTAWCAEDCQSVLDPAFLEMPVDAVWQRVKGLTALPAPAFTRGVALARWREVRARTDNLPRGWVLKDPDLLAVAHAAPKDPRALAAVLPDNPAFVRRHGETVCELLRTGDAAASAATPAPPMVPTAAERAQAKACAERLRGVAATLAIEPSVLMTRREIEALVRGECPARLRQGWRAAILHDLIADCTSARMR